MGVLVGRNKERSDAILTPNELVFTFGFWGFLDLCQFLVKIDQEMRPGECAQTDTRMTDAIRFFNLSYAISQLTNLCKTLAAAILLTSSTHFGARLGAFFY